MRKAIVSLLAVFITVSCWSQPLPVRLKHTIIIDTDCGIDDMRAISLLLERPEIEIAAILLSDGSLMPDEGKEKIKSLLHEFDRDNIPVACGDILRGVNPPWREFNKGISWSKENIKVTKCPEAVKTLSEKLLEINEKVTLVCLGPLTTSGRLFNIYPGLISEIERIIWYNDYSSPLKGFNYECDRENADLVFKSGIRIDVISNLGNKAGTFDTVMYNVCRDSKTVLGSVFYSVHKQDAVLRRLNENHFRLCDELIAIYITNPELFDINLNTSKLNIRYNRGYNAQGIREAMTEMISGNYASEKNVVFRKFPVQRDMFNYDIRPIIDTAIALYGMDEWKANVMTDEFHGHLGVFSIVGAKMGIKARELFGVGPDELSVLTFAGSKPPYSCLTDGIQVSTGATLGMGTIRLADDPLSKPSAIFTYRNRSVMITLKKEYLEKVEADINEGIVKFGLMDDGYWKLVRYNAIKYWVEWDRNKIFDVEEVKPELTNKQTHKL